jgi:hypothetical protein
MIKFLIIKYEWIYEIKKCLEEEKKITKTIESCKKSISVNSHYTDIPLN